MSEVPFGREDSGDGRQWGRTLFVNFLLADERECDTIHVRGDESGKISTRNQQEWIASHCFKGSNI